jgi:hypothetical protein
MKRFNRSDVPEEHVTISHIRHHVLTGAGLLRPFPSPAKHPSSIKPTESPSRITLPAAMTHGVAPLQRPHRLTAHRRGHTSLMSLPSFIDQIVFLTGQSPPGTLPRPVTLPAHRHSAGVAAPPPSQAVPCFCHGLKEAKWAGPLSRCRLSAFVDSAHCNSGVSLLYFKLIQNSIQI